MTNKYWKSNKNNEVIDFRREQLQALFAFANADFVQNGIGQQKGRVYDFFNFVLPDHSRISRNLFTAKSAKLILGLQKHLGSRLKEIVDAKKMLWEMPMWKLSGTLEFSLDVVSNQFIESFSLPKTKSRNELKSLERLTNKRIIEIIRDLDLKPRRFHQCPRCGNFFYQPTDKEKKFCSIRCGDAVRLQKFRKERRKLKDEKSSISV